jgi:hypothetical protein
MKTGIEPQGWVSSPQGELVNIDAEDCTKMKSEEFGRFSSRISGGQGAPRGLERFAQSMPA